MRRILLVLAALGLTTGVAAADRWHGGENHGGYVQHGYVQRGGGWQGGARGGGNWQGGVHVSPSYRGGYVNHGYVNRGYVNGGYNRGYVHGGYGYGYARRPVYVRSPIIREHYYDYYRRPSVIVENYAPMDGYTWVPGQWQWSGYEWIWQPGHYEPIADAYYNSGYGYGCANGATDADCDGD